jgi:hypothetical protein
MQGHWRKALSNTSRQGPATAGTRAKRPDPIFQIGFNRCGTLSLHKFLLSSGLRSLHWAEELLAVKIANRIDAGQDPIKDFPRAIGFTDMVGARDGLLVEPYKRFDYLHRWYPNALFILNTRDREKWIDSRSAHQYPGGGLIKGYANYLRIPESRVPDFWRAEWYVHHIQVRAYFAGAPNFLEFHIERDDPQKLTSFIAQRYPQCAETTFGVHNQRKSRD